MPRIARNIIPGTFFHIMVQGINKEDIFEKDNYKLRYKKIIRENIEKFQIKVISYCIMSNHTHILIYTDNIDTMIKFMHNVNTSYAIYYNKVKSRVGYVFRDRFRTQTILNENHLKNCIVYIHKNPVKAQIVDNEEKYKYSSYNEYIKNSEIIDIKFIKTSLGLTTNSWVKNILAMHRNDKIKDKFIDVQLKNKLTDAECNGIIEKYRSEGLEDRVIVKYLMENYNISERNIASHMNLTRYKIRELLR